MVDWEKIIRADADHIANDEDAAENFFEFLTKCDFTESDVTQDAKNVVKLFDIAKSVLMVKGLQYETALDEMEKITQEASADKERALIEENKRLSNELALIQRQAGSGDTFYRNEVLKLEERNKSLQNEIDELERRLLKEQNSYDRVNSDLQSLESRYQNTKHELDRALSDVQEYQRQFQAQRENLLASKGQDENIQKVMVKKNRELADLLDELKQLQEDNDSLQKEVDKAKSEMEKATDDMNSMAADYTKLKTVLEDTDQIVEDMRKERDLLKAQIHDMQIQLQKKSEGDDELMLTFNKKITEFKDILINKDKEVQEKDRQLFELEKQLQAAKLDTDRSKMLSMMEENSRKEKKIKDLEEELEAATKDMNNVTSQINTLKYNSSNTSVSIKQEKKIAELSNTIAAEQTNTQKERDRVIEVELDIAEKDKQISELVNKLIQYEQGQYGLSEAVQEIKECKSQIRVREKTIEELTKQMNQLYIDVNELNLENEEMRERLGIPSREDIDTEGIKKKKAIKEEQTLAVNRVLLKEVEQLEEERVQLKKALRNAALERGEKAVNLGLTALDLEPVEEMRVQPNQQYVFQPVPTADVTVPQTVIQQIPVGGPEKNVSEEKHQIESENKNLKEELHQLEIGLREIHGALKNPATNTKHLQIPALERLIAIIEERYATGQYDTTVNLKSEIDRLHGRNEELRLELRNAQNEITNFSMETEKNNRKITIQEKEIETLREKSAGVIKLNPLPLPDGINPTSKDVIACLNEYLMQVLQELSNKEEICSNMEEALEKARRDFSIAIHQQSVLYKEYLEMCNENDNIKLEFDKEKQSLYLIRDENDIKVQEFNKLLKHLETDPSKHKQLLTELTRKITVLRVNEKSLARRYTILQEVEKSLRHENGKLKDDMLALEATVKKKIGDLQRHKDMSVYKIASLQKALDDTVPASELELANRKFNELTAKYRDLLQKENVNVSNLIAVDTLKSELKVWQHSEKTLKEKLLVEKEKTHVLEQTLSDLVEKLGSHANGIELRTSEITSLARKVATLEMKEINERERAEHAHMKYEQLKKLVDEVESRNTSLEARFSEITKLNLESQRIERELREELANCVPADINRADKKNLKLMEEKLGTLEVENHRLREVADIAQHQVETVSSRQKCQEKELASLRHQIHDFQIETDEKTVIAKLHQQIIAMQVSEATAFRKLEIANKNIKNLESFNLKLQGILDEKNEALFLSRHEWRSKSKYLKKTIQDLRTQYSGALPLPQQERFSNTLKSYHERKIQLERDLDEARRNRLVAENKSLEYEMKAKGLEELIATLQDGQGAKKVVQWHNTMGEIKLENMKLKRQVENEKEKIIYLEKTVERNEESVSILQQEIANLEKEHENRHLLWEQHEIELERKIYKLERQQKDITDTARRFEEASGSMPDQSLPVAHQLEIALVKIKEHIKTIVTTKEEIKWTRQELESAEEKLRAAETSLMQKDRVINELRLRLPISERDTISALTEQPVSSAATESNHDVKQALQIAHTTIDSLKVMLQKKDDSIAKYQEMLKSSRQELQSQEERHRNETKVLQDRLQLEIDEHIKKVKKFHLDYVNAPQAKPLANQQLQRLIELEEMLAEQDTALGTASEKYRKGKQEMVAIKEEAQDNIKKLKEEMNQKELLHDAEIKTLKKAVEDDLSKLREKDLEIEVLTQELESARQAAEKAPSKTMRSLVERLRNQLEKKDKEQKSLSQALAQLRSDMVATAEENVQVFSRKAEEEINVQKLLERETNKLQTRIEDLQQRMNKLNKEVKKRKDHENELTEEVDALKKDVIKKENALKEMAFELKKREDFEEKNEQLEAQVAKLVKQQPKKIMREDSIEPVKESLLESENVDAVESEKVNAINMNDLDHKPVKETKTKEEVIRWEESKKWQRKLETLKTKLKEKSEECMNHEKTESMLREAVARQEKDKLILNNRLKTLNKRGGGDDVNVFRQEENIAGLKNRIFQLEDENNDLLRKEFHEKGKEIQELRIDNTQLREALHALETQLLEEKPDGIENYEWSMQREQTIKKEVLEVRKENMELRFELEQANRDNPRLKARLADLNEYVEILKNELNASRKKDKEKQRIQGPGQGGQSVEDMERVIAAMRRVVERLQTENDLLKKQTAKPKTQNDLVKENRQLKQELQKLKQTQSNNKSSRQKFSGPSSISKLTQENDKLRKDLKKEQELCEDLRIENASIKTLNENLKENLVEKEKIINELEAGQDNITTLTDGRHNKSAVVSKLFDNKIKTLENEINKKNNILKEIKSHLRSSAERESELLRKVDELEAKVIFLQEYPPGITTESDINKQYQQSRLQVRRLEAEKKEMKFELDRLMQLTNNGSKKVDVTDNEVLEKLRNYDRMLAIEVDLRSRIKGMEIEREKYINENKKLKKELSAFDPSFFDELEDLKYNYKKSIEKNILYEQQLEKFSKQFGIEVHILK